MSTNPHAKLCRPSDVVSTSHVQEISTLPRFPSANIFIFPFTSPFSDQPRAPQSLYPSSSVPPTVPGNTRQSWAPLKAMSTTGPWRCIIPYLSPGAGRNSHHLPVTALQGSRARNSQVILVVLLQLLPLPPSLSLVGPSRWWVPLAGGTWPEARFRLVLSSTMPRHDTFCFASSLALCTCTGSSLC